MTYSWNCFKKCQILMTANPNFETWATSYSGCDGGDIGSPERRAIWLCGIEWGGARTAEQLQDEMQCDEPCPPRGYGGLYAVLCGT